MCNLCLSSAFLLGVGSRFVWKHMVSLSKFELSEMLCRVDWRNGWKDTGVFFLRAKQSTIKQLDPKAKGKTIHFTQQYHYNTPKNSLRIVSSAILCVQSVETLGCTLCLAC